MWRALQTLSSSTAGVAASSTFGRFQRHVGGMDTLYAMKRAAVPARRLCSSRGTELVMKRPELKSELPTYDELVRVPVPAGIPTDQFGVFQVNDSSRALRDIPGEDCLFGVHGPEEEWAPKGLVEGHGACGGLFAVIAAAGKQFRVMPGDVMYTMRMKGEVNSTHMFDDVLLLGAVDWTLFGRPCIRDAVVVATIEEQARSGKIYIEKFKKRTGYRRRSGHRQPITRLRIKEIRYIMPPASRIVAHDMGYNPLTPERNFWFTN